ncbi:MAG: flippase [Thermoleophilia bacterium]
MVDNVKNLLEDEIDAAAKPPDHVVAMVSIFKGASINLLGITSHIFLVFGYSVFLARALNGDDLGRYFLGFTMLNFLVIVATLGLDFAIWRYVAMHIANDDQAKAKGVILSSLAIAAPSSIICCIGLVVLSGWISGGIFSDPGMETVLRWFAIALPFMVLARIFNASTQGLRKMHYQVISKDIGEQASRFAISIALISFGLMGVLFANIMAVAVSAALAFWFLQRSLPVVGFGMAQVRFREVIVYSMPLAFSTVFSYLLLWLDSWLLGYFRGPAEVGAYGIAGRVAILGTLVLASFNTMFAPVISDLYSRHEMERLKILFRFVTKWVVIISLPIFMIVVTLSVPVLRIFGEEFTLVSSSLIILAIGQFINSATGPVAGMVLMSGRSYLDLVNNISAVILNVVLCILMIPAWGIIGAASANAITQATINIIRAVEIYFIMGLHGYDRTYFKPALSAGVAGALAFCLYLLLGSGGSWQAVVFAALFISCYIMMMAFVGLSPEDRGMVRLIKDRLVAGKSV